VSPKILRYAQDDKLGSIPVPVVSTRWDFFFHRNRPGATIQLMPEEVTGTIERITFHNSENGFSVLRVRPKGKSSVITVVGNAPGVAEGESIQATGKWRDDKIHGRQFQAEAVSLVRAVGRAQIETFLGSGAIRGVGPSTAQQLYTHFGEKVFDVLEQTPERLRELTGIGPKRVKLITDSWQNQKTLRELMLFLTETGIGVTRAGRIHKQFGADAVRVIKENPYRLAREIRGIGFATADALALKLGMDRDSIERIRAGVVHALSEASVRGHCGMPLTELTTFCASLLRIPEDRIGEAVGLEVDARRLIRDTIGGLESMFLPRLHVAEKRIGLELRSLVDGKPPWPKIDAEKAMQWVESQTGMLLADSQRSAIELVLRSKVTVITGGPGVGKTTLVNSILKILLGKKTRVLLAAPTGRAAKRLSESTSAPAKTIHRLLEVQADSGRFLRDEMNPLECDLLVLDEASMIDVYLMEAVVRALPPAAALLLVGDVDQLPAVGPGDVLSDVIRSAAIPVVRLAEVFRQAAESRIIVNAHEINEGRMPHLGVPEGEQSDFFFVSVSDPSSVAERVVKVVRERIPARFGFDPLRDVQVLCPMRKTISGVDSINSALQAALNPRSQLESSERLDRLGVTYFVGDKVMQVVNNYEKDVLNGDIGLIQSIDSGEGLAVVDFDGKQVQYAQDELEDLVLSYATTIHKSQGSEYAAVVIVLTLQHAIMLQRNLLYTAVTRGRRLVVLIGDSKAIEQAVGTRSSRQRWTRLGEWLREGVVETEIPGSDPHSAVTGR